jgi:carbon-monoxide dehydrogenase medium subunit
MTTARYSRPDTLEEAVTLLAGDEFSKVLAGGQSLIPMMSLGLARPSLLVDIGRVSDAPGTAVSEGTVGIGPGCRHADLEPTGTAIDRAAPMLAVTAPWIANPAIRSRGTFLGSIAHGDPAAEWPAVAVALDTRLELRSPRGARQVPASAFFLGPLMTAIEPDEVLVAAYFPVAPPGTRAVTMELAIRHGDYAIVGVCVQLTPDSATDGAIADARIGLFGVDATPVRARDAEQALIEGGRSAVQESGALAAAACDPMSDVSASAAYRRRMVEVHVRRALSKAIDPMAAA